VRRKNTSVLPLAKEGNTLALSSSLLLKSPIAYQTKSAVARVKQTSHKRNADSGDSRAGLAFASKLDAD
jgi:hypothetical protein